MKNHDWRIPALVATGTIVFIIFSLFWIDIPAARFCKDLGQNIKDFFEFITPLGISTGYLVGSFSLGLLFKYYFRRPIYAHRAFFLFASIAVSGILAVILKWVAGRFRPKVLFEENLYGFNFFAAGYEKNSFPSGHATTVFSLALVLALFFPKYRIPLFCFALIVGASRVIITSHYLSDMAGGALVAFVTVFFLRQGAEELERRGYCKIGL